ncbi:alpha/beta hydrolase [Marinilabilia rubra]|uniref:Alpha/beta hydrolase n=1 Tax=Marinilabilia rubra TaxID=2162893 RepID=A0A2U2B9E7_9BACT|nr:alpha/beta hydrolase [Marinilabilia rubra]PWD99699.1 alpha/beta hydrolase [Marinilabilia rubra]
MKLFTSALLLLVICSNIVAQTEEEPVTLETPTGNIEGTLWFPSSSGKIPVALIIAGSGPTDRNGNNPMMTNNSLKMLAEGLAGKNIASVRYDKRGIAQSRDAGPEEANIRFDNFVDDAKAWVDLIDEDSRFSEIIIIGHSEGSLIGMIASQKREVAKFISLEGGGIPAGDLLREQLKNQPPMVLNPSLPIIEQLEKGEMVDSVPQMLYSLFRPSVQPYMILWFKYNPQEEIAKLDKPILIVQGTTDIQTSISDAEKLAKANDNAEKLIVEGMNHILKDAEADRQKNIQTYNNPDLPLKEGLIESLAEFIKE